MIFASKEIFVVSGDTFYCYNLGWEWEEALLLIYMVSRGEDAAAKHPIIYGAGFLQHICSAGVEKSCFGMPGWVQEDPGFCHGELFHFSPYFTHL